DAASVNISEPEAAELCAMLAERGIGVEVGVASVGDTLTLIQSGAAAHAERVLIEVEGDAGDALVEITAIDALLDHAGITLPRLAHGYGGTTWAILDRAFRLGHDVRIGFEDTLALPNGRPARSNGELVAALMARQAG